MTRSTFIITIVVSHWKWLNLPISNEKLMNLENPGSLLLQTWILSSASLCATSCLVSYLWISYALRLLLYFWPCILCIMSLNLFFGLSLALSLVGFPFLLGCSRSARFSLYIVGLDKQSYIELIANQYRCYIGLVWRCNIYLAFRPFRLICITHCPSTGPSNISLTTTQPSCVIQYTGLIQVSCLPQISWYNTHKSFAKFRHYNVNKQCGNHLGLGPVFHQLDERLDLGVLYSMQDNSQSLLYWFSPTKN